MKQYPLSNSFVDDGLLSFITLNTKIRAYELKSYLNNKSEWTLCHLSIQI